MVVGERGISRLRVEKVKIQIDSADRIFSQFIRLRDKRCQRCFSLVRMNGKGLPISHTASHYFGRGRENTRFDTENVDTVCFSCHRIWGSDDKEGYRMFKIKQLGEQGFKLLQMRSEMYKKKDRKMSLLIAKEMLNHLLKTGD